MTAHPEHALQTMVNKCVGNHVPMPHFFCGIDRSQKHGDWEHARQKARGLIAGTPDTILVVPGLPLIAIELKAKGKKVAPDSNQERVGLAIRAAGGFWGWCDSVIGYMLLLEEAGVPLQGRWDIAAAGHDVTLASAAIRREEAKTGAPSRNRTKSTSTQLRKVRAIYAKGVLF